MPVTVKVNGTANSLVHKGSNGVSMATVPDVCKTPSPGGPVPLPYPNVSQSATLAKGTTTVKADGKMIAIKGSEFSMSNGDNAGTLGGVKSSTFMKESTWISYSFDVKMEGKNACRLTDKKFQNHQNTVDLGGTLQAPVAVKLGLSTDEIAVADCLCDNFCTKLKSGFKKGPRGGWSKKAAITQRQNWSYELEREMEGKPSQPAPACLSGHDVKFTEQFPGNPKTIPDATMRDASGKVCRCFDFKFPGDRFRGSQWRRQRKLAGGKKPVEISAKTCACT